MQVLVAAATYNEVSLTAEWLKKKDFPVEILITGVGMMATTYSLMRTLMHSKPDLVIQAGIGGSFSDQLPVTTTVLIGDEVVADLGAIGTDGLVDIFDMGFAMADGFPFKNKRLINPHLAEWSAFGLPVKKGATVNAVSSTAAQAARIRAKYDPDIESMEGAGLHFACLQEHVRFIQLRSISNFAGDREKRNWNIPGAVAALNDHLQKMLQTVL